jgi:hypothetical protein
MERRAALAVLREAKARELSDGTGVDRGDDDSSSSSSSSSSIAQEALRGYRNAYYKVQELREIVPGVRIWSPVIDAENARAARQFLGIILDDSSGGGESSSPGMVESSPPEGNQQTSKLALVVLVVVGLSQLALRIFMVSLHDPFLQPCFDVDDNNNNNNNNNRYTTWPWLGWVRKRGLVRPHQQPSVCHGTRPCTSPPPT